MKKKIKDLTLEEFIVFLGKEITFMAEATGTKPVNIVRTLYKQNIVDYLKENGNKEIDL